MKFLACLFTLLAAATLRAELRVPAFTAYLDPAFDSAEVSVERGITGWTNPAVKVLWFGDFKTGGKLDCALALRLPQGEKSKLRLTINGHFSEATAIGAGDNLIILKFGAFDIPAPGFQRLTLEALTAPGKPCGALDALILNGPALQDAHFNLDPRRNAASVHLSYPLSKDANVEAFYCEVTGVQEPVWTYYMACGWHRGYFGMQINSPTERRIIFSVWDSGSEAVSRDKVAAPDRVTLMAKGESVVAGDFGNEGTGGHSHLIYPWKTGEKQRFIVTAKPVDATHTIFSGFYFHPEKKTWMLISSWKAPKEGGYLRGLYSFSENFGGSNGHLQRKALFGNQWIRTDRSDWIELLTANFSHDSTGRTNRLDRYMGLEDGQFFLSQGGFVPGFTKAGEKFTRPPTDKAPMDIKLPPL